MIEGEVNADNEMALPVFVYAADGHLADGHLEEFRAVIDTGFSGHLTLPTDRVVALGLPFYTRQVYYLGENQPVSFDVYRATITWDGQDREVSVLASDGDCLIGMQLLRNAVLFSDILDGGRVLVRGV